MRIIQTLFNVFTSDPTLLQRVSFLERFLDQRRSENEQLRRSAIELYRAKGKGGRKTSKQQVQASERQKIVSGRRTNRARRYSLARYDRARTRFASSKRWCADPSLWNRQLLQHATEHHVTLDQRSHFESIMLRLPPMLPLLLLFGATVWTSVHAVDTLCSLPPATYTSAKKEHSDVVFALNQLEEFGIATWYSDRQVNGDPLETITELVDTCDESTRLSVVVYGLPNKDCSAGYSNGNGTVETTEDYVDFVTQLADAVGKRKVLYVLEPDAVGLIADGGCAVDSGYKANLLLAIPILAGNPNAEIYLDVGFWTLSKADSASKVAQIVKELSRAGRLKGITLNTSNYRSTDEIAQLCTNFQEAIESTTMHCIIDTSRNFAVPGAVVSSEWCNKRTAGIGIPPTNATGYDNLDYFVWIKPPGDSDGTCDEADRSNDSMKGPEAGVFFKSHFIKLWNQGHFVQEMKMVTIVDPSESSGAAALQSQLRTALVAMTVSVVAVFWMEL